ncbi:DUF1801 domain-containing protein [Neptunitalea lumnitzerae]|uniref:YdhG-like domain-containing protein n=1 Tax=Neptunitalea lumnitzerae TaxID=2965509 RepID=A0ABQ5MET4_9FLAO|nr:DUF1801 domain-containing protein [Neptunitalea sp. Y10]GLB47911.1 hypothetical protein Y10_02790 [Neptunitalea sp. Y10]
MISEAILTYNAQLPAKAKATCALLSTLITQELPEAENKIWHAHPVWFLEGNPIVGYSNLKDGVRLLFWSGQSFEEPGLEPQGKFKAAEKRYQLPDDVDIKKLKLWLSESRNVQWDYKNIVKRKGVLIRLV